MMGRIEIIRELGSYGSAYDGPERKRAYTYKHQPSNDAAYNLGCALYDAMNEMGGYPIDAGLILLKNLQKRGFGVFDSGYDGDAK